MDTAIVIFSTAEHLKTTPVKKGRNNMKTKTTIAFSCPEKTARIIDEYSSRLGISRSACITMMCNAYIVADNRYGFSNITGERIKGAESNAD